MADPANTGIYEIVNILNRKRYVGSAVDIKSRWRGHRHQLNKGTHHSIAMQRAWRKYGEAVFVFNVLVSCSKSDLLSREQEAFDRLSPEYNILKVAGSALGSTKSESAREKMRIFRTGKRLSPETRAKISASNMGRKNSAASIAKYIATRTGKKSGPMSEEHKAKIAAAHLGRKLSAEHSEKISRAKTGKPRPDMVGNRFGSYEKSPETRLKSSLAQKGKPKPRRRSRPEIVDSPNPPS